jgi:hypothetical protein
MFAPYLEVLFTAKKSEKFLAMFLYGHSGRGPY